MARVPNEQADLVRPNPNLPGRLKQNTGAAFNPLATSSAKPKSAWQIETAVAAADCDLPKEVRPNPNLPGRLCPETRNPGLAQLPCNGKPA